MNGQAAIDIFAKVLPVLIDIASMIPGVSVPLGAVKVVEDGIALEQSAHLFFTQTAEGRAVWAKTQGLAKDLGLALGAPAPVAGLRALSYDEALHDADQGRF